MTKNYWLLQLKQEYKEIKKILDDRKNWKNLARKYWNKQVGEKITEVQQFVIIALLHRVWLLLLKENEQDDDNYQDNENNNKQPVTHNSIAVTHTWIAINILDILGEEEFESREIVLQQWEDFSEKERKLTHEKLQETRKT